MLEKYPLKTTLYYFKHILLLDVLGYAPFRQLAAKQKLQR
jgi:hypothetical protein